MLSNVCKLIRLVPQILPRAGSSSSETLVKLRPVRNAPSGDYQLILLLLYASNPATGGMVLKLRGPQVPAQWDAP